MKILIGVSASIAIYKSCDLVRELSKQGHDVHVAMTKTAAQWINPVVFAALSNNKVLTEESARDQFMPHIEVRENLDLFLIAPATAHLISRCASASAGDIITSTLLSYDGPRFIAPAMNPFMYKHSGVQKNIEILKEYGYTILEPSDGEAVCGDQGSGKMMSVSEIIDKIIIK